MNYLDIIFIIIVAALTIHGFRKGLIKSIGGILGLFVAIYAAVIFYSRGSDWAMSTFNFLTTTEAKIISFIIIFIIAKIIFALFIFLLDRIFNLPILGLFNRLFGAIFGFLEGILFITIVLAVLANFGIGQEVMSESKVVPYSNRVFGIIKPVLPSDLKSVSISDFINNSKATIQDYTTQNLDNMNIDELIDYFSKNQKIPDSVIQQAKNEAMKNGGKVTAQEIKNRFQEYLNNLQ